MPEETTRNVLLLGASWLDGTAPAFERLAGEAGLAVRCARARAGAGTLRAAARALAEGTDCALDGDGGVQTMPLAAVLALRPWDAVVLEQPGSYAGLAGSCNGDLSCLIDAVRDLAPAARLFWNMVWRAPEDGEEAAQLRLWYDGNADLAYNAAADLLTKKILGERAPFAPSFAGWTPTGCVMHALGSPRGEERCVAEAAALLRGLLPGRVPKRMDAVLERVWAAASAVDLTRGAERAPVPAARTVERESRRGDVTVGRASAPLKLHFPDLAVLSDGTVIVGAYAAVGHKTDPRPESEAYCAEGSAAIVVWDSRDGGKTWNYDRPLLTVDDAWLEQYGVGPTSGRWAALKRGEKDYVIANDPRDPNFGVVWEDGREVLLLTFYVRHLHPWGRSISHWAVRSADGGRTWSAPAALERLDGGETLKRGDLAAFADGEVLFPCYDLSHAMILAARWNGEGWERLGDFDVPNTAPEVSGAINEVSLWIPRPEEDTVFAFVRESGAVLRSDDRARTWRQVGLEPGLIHQPGFAPLDEQRAFVTWARVTSPRTCYGKVFFAGGDWTDTRTRTVYASPVTGTHDMGDPSCKRLADGRVLTVCYDTAYRAVVGSFCDPEGEDFAPVELDGAAGRAVLYHEEFPAGRELAGGVLPETRLPGRYTLEAAAVLPEDGCLTADLPGAGRVILRAGEDAPADVPILVRIAAVGGAVWTACAPAGERGAWTRKKPGPGGPALAVGGRGRLTALTVFHRVEIRLPDEMLGFAGLTALPLEARVQPRPATLRRRTETGNAAVEPDGTVRFLAPGRDVIVLEADGVEARCPAACLPVPPELSGAGTPRTLFRDDFSGYEPGEGAFFRRGPARGWAGRPGDAPTPDAGDGIVRRDGEQFLLLHARQSRFTWYEIDRPATGPFTLKFDFFFTDPRPSPYDAAPGQYLYLNLWQGDETVFCMVHLAPEGVRAEWRAPGEDGTRYQPRTFDPAPRWPLNVWHTARVTRVEKGLFVRVWPRGGPEPEKWDLALAQRALDVSRPACARFQYYAAGSKTRYLALANVSVTKTEN